MQIKKILTKRQRADIDDMLIDTYKSSFNFEDYHLYTMQDDKLWLLSKTIDIHRYVDLKRCYRLGIYFGKLKRNNKIKLTIEGAMLVGKTAKKNIAIVDEKEALLYTQGFDINNFTTIDASLHNYVLLKYGDDVIGCGLLRDTYIENLISKARRLVKIDKTK